MTNERQLLSSPLLTTCLLAAAVAATTCTNRRSKEERPLGRGMNLSGFTAVPRSDVFRADLADDGGSYGGRTTNILFIEPSGQSRWLLPDNDHSVEQHPVGRRSGAVADADYEDSAADPIAIVALVTPREGDAHSGQLLIFDPTGRRVTTVSEHVRAVLGVSFSEGRGVSVLYERQHRQYVLASFDPATLKNTRDTVVSVPDLN